MDSLGQQRCDDACCKDFQCARCSKDSAAAIRAARTQAAINARSVAAVGTINQVPNAVLRVWLTAIRSCLGNVQDPFANLSPDTLLTAATLFASAPTQATGAKNAEVEDASSGSCEELSAEEVRKRKRAVIVKNVEVARAAAASSKVEAPRGAETRCEDCNGVLYQCRMCSDIDKAMRQSLRKRKAAPSSNVNAKRQDLFHRIVKQQFHFHDVPRDGHCLFRAFIQGYQKVTKKHLTLQDVRGTVAAYLLQHEGRVPGQKYEFFETDEADGSIILSDAIRVLRGSKVEATRTTLAQYAEQVGDNLYGGDLETQVLAHVYKVRIGIYSWHFFDGAHRFSAQYYGDADAPGFDILYEQNFRSKTGRQDHYSFIVDKFPKWRKRMSAMPTWKVDIGLCVNERGRGCKALKDFKKGDPLMFYDGHRVDEKGNVVIQRVHVEELYQKYGVDPRAETFKKTHAVCLGRVHVTGLQIDGYPLTLPIFDDVPDIGRGALCNSGTPQESNMKMVWLEAPDLMGDPINHLADCEGFLVARRDISAGEELLWHYSLHKISRVRNVDMSFDYSSCDETAAISSPVPRVDDRIDIADDSSMTSGSDDDVVVPAPKIGSEQQEDENKGDMDVGPDWVVGDESEDDDEHQGHCLDTAFAVNDECVVGGCETASGVSPATVVGRIVGHSTRNVQKYIVKFRDGLISTVGSDCIHEWSGGGIADALETADVNGNGEGAAAEHDASTSNASGLEALELAGRIVHFDVGKMSANDIWNLILLRRDLSGGMLMRTILIAASGDAQCLPLWNLGTKQEQTVQKKRLQGIDFIQHFTPQAKLDWLRVKVFQTVVANRNSYGRINMSFNGCTSLSLGAVSGVEVTDSLRCRVAHLALQGETIRILGMIFGSRDTRDKHDDAGLKGPSLWETLAHDYVNNSLWQPYSEVATHFHACEDLDPSVHPARPGLHSTVVQEIFLEARSEWTRLKNRVDSPTGCNETGDKLLNEVWTNFINGGRVTFRRKEVLMYIFASWTAAGKDLPEFCSRQLCTTHKLIVGTGPTPQTPYKDKGSTSSASTPSPKYGGKHSSSLETIANVMKNMTDLMAAAAPNTKTPSKLHLDTNASAASFEGELPAPEDELLQYMRTHNISTWWPQIYGKLGVSSVKDLRYIGKANTLLYLHDLPALPCLKIAELAGTSELPPSTQPSPPK